MHGPAGFFGFVFYELNILRLRLPRLYIEVDLHQQQLGVLCRTEHHERRITGSHTSKAAFTTVPTTVGFPGEGFFEKISKPSVPILAT